MPLGGHRHSSSKARHQGSGDNTSCLARATIIPHRWVPDAGKAHSAHRGEAEAEMLQPGAGGEPLPGRAVDISHPNAPGEQGEHSACSAQLGAEERGTPCHNSPQQKHEPALHLGRAHLCGTTQSHPADKPAVKCSGTGEGQSNRSSPAGGREASCPPSFPARPWCTQCRLQAQHPSPLSTGWALSQPSYQRGPWARQAVARRHIGASTRCFQEAPEQHELSS